MHVQQWLVMTVAGALAGQSGIVAAQEGIEEVVVTAQKREQSLGDVPVSVAVFDEETFNTRQVDAIGEIAAILPSFEFARAPSDSPGVTFRGIGTQAGNVAFDNSIGMFVDGAFLGNVRLYGQTLFDVQRIELIKGTQSTLLGKNVSLGAISVVNNTPGSEFGGNMEVGAEVQNGGWFADGAVDAPVSDELALRFAGRYSDLDGWITNNTFGTEVPADRDIGGRASARWAPGGAFDALVSYQYTDNQRLGSANQITDPGLSALGLGEGPDLGESNFDDTKESFSSDPRLENGEDLTELKAHMVTATLNYDLDDLVVTSVSSFATFDFVNNLDFDFDNKDATVLARSEDYWQFSQELRIASSGGRRFDWLAGLFYFQSDWDMVQDSDWGIPDFPPPPDPISGELFNGPFTNTFQQDTTAWSLFGQINWYLTSRLTANVGVRFTRETKNVNFGRTNRAPFTLWNTVIQAPFPFQELDEVTDDIPSGTFSLQYQAGENTMIYAAAARGGKSGGYGEFNSIPLDPALGQGNPNRDAFIDDERANSYEVGVKSTLLNRRLQLSAALFHIDVFGLQQLVFTGEFVSSNDRARSSGMEGLMSLQVSDRLRLTASGTYADAEEKDDNVRLGQSPRVSLALGGNWAAPVFADWTLDLGARMRYRSSKFNQPDEGLEDGPFTTLALTARLTSDSSPWFANIVAENVTNAIGADFGFTGPDPYVAIFETAAPLRSIKLSFGRGF